MFITYCQSDGQTSLIIPPLHFRVGSGGRLLFQSGVLDSGIIPAAEKHSRRLLIALHGLGDSAAGYQWLPQVMQLPWLNYQLVNAPEPYFGGYSWYDFAGDPAPGLARSRRLLFELLDTCRQRGFPTDQTTLFGFSQGCVMTWEAGFRYPHRFAGLVGVSGHAYDAEHALQELSPVAREQRFLVTHGTLDPLIPFAPVRAQIQILKQAGLRIEWHELEKDHTIEGEAELSLIRNFIRAGHPES